MTCRSMALAPVTVPTMVLERAPARVLLRPPTLPRPRLLRGCVSSWPKPRRLGAIHGTVAGGVAGALVTRRRCLAPLTLVVLYPLPVTNEPLLVRIRKRQRRTKRSVVR